MYAQSLPILNILKHTQGGAFFVDTVSFGLEYKSNSEKVDSVKFMLWYGCVVCALAIFACNSIEKQNEIVQKSFSKLQE